MAYAALDLGAASAALKAGAVIAFPTETFYGIGCDALNPDAVGAVYAIKQRPYKRPLPVVIGELSRLSRIAGAIPPVAERLMDVFWPGPLSILLPAAAETPDLLSAGTGRIAVRFSSHPACVELCRASGLILTASSANISGQAPVTRPEELDAGLARNIRGVYVDGPPPAGGGASTIVDILRDGDEGRLRVLREGAVSVESLLAAGFRVLHA